MAPRRSRSTPPDQFAADVEASAADVDAGAEELAAAVLGALTTPGRPASRQAATRRRIPLSLRRAANRPAGPRGSAPSQRLRDAADAGLLTRSNTQSGTAGRRAVDRSMYLRRRAAEPDISAREALGHRPAGAPARKTTFYTTDPPRMVTAEGVNLRDVHRGSEYMRATNALLIDLKRASGDPARVARVKRDFARRWRRRAPIAGHPFLADADAVVALAELVRTGDVPIVFDSGRSRPGRRRRTTSRRSR